jgi:hypothetical protein
MRKKTCESSVIWPIFFYLMPKPMASPVDKMAQFLKKPWTLFPHNPIICQKIENKKKAVPARKGNYNQHRANALL